MTLMVLDGNSIANRAFYGIRPLSAPDGTPTNAIYGFFNILNSLLKEYKPDGLCVAFDLSAPTFRHRSCDFYKAQRKPMPEELKAQMPLLKEILEKMGVSVLEKEGFEADDILGTLAKNCDDNLNRCILVTGDRDSLQLVSDNTSVCLVRTKDHTLYTPEVFEQEYGFAPKGMVDLKALQGDSSDNIPGVPGVGEKTAKDLIGRFGSIEKIYEDLAGLDIKESVRKKLSEGKDSALQSYWLATIFREVPLEKEDYTWSRDCYKSGLHPLLNRLGLRKLIEGWKVPESKVGSEPLPPKTSSVPTPSNAADDSAPEHITVTPNLKQLYKQGFEGDAFDTTIAQYLICPTQKSYPETASYKELNDKLEELSLKELYYDVELPLTRVLASMETEGIAVDRDALDTFGKTLGESIDTLSQNIYFRAGKTFNINSPKQLGEILFDTLHLPDKKKRSTAAEVLESLRYANPIVDDILEYRELAKLKSTYTDGLQQYIQPDGKIRTTFQQTVTATGRLSSTDPNLQNIPIRKELGSKLRKMFVAGEGNVLIDADYSQIELRLLAHIAQDQAMIDAFNSGEDFHRVTASKVFGIPLDQVTATERSRAKAVNFGIVYGISAFSLANDLHISNAEAKDYMDAYFAKFTGVANYMKTVVEQAKKDGYVTTMFNRRRDLPELSSSNFTVRKFGERVALNMPIQGSAADIIKMAMNKAYDALKSTGAKLILQVHDELIAECPEEEKTRVSEILRSSMESVTELSVPLLVDVGSGKDWAEAH